MDEVQLDPAHPATTRLPYAEAAVHKAVAEAVGTGSVCWESMSGTGVFNDALALQAVDRAVTSVISAVGLGEPHLGCATTAEIREELRVRDLCEVSAADDYRTVDD